MFATVINDCHCQNARGRQETRIASLLECPVNFVSVNSDLEAAGNLVDILDAGLGRKGVVLVNVAPRDKNHGGNGAPFCYFYYKDTLVITTEGELILSLVKKLGLVEKVRRVDLEETVKLRSREEKEAIAATQFRSFEFTPRLAWWLFRGLEVVSSEKDLQTVKDAGRKIWWVDNFGNIKTSVIAGGKEAEKTIEEWKDKGWPYFPKLKDVPLGERAIITGSSGVEGKRFLELVINKGNAAQELDLRVGDGI
jgi:hypothetical protein